MWPEASDCDLLGLSLILNTKRVLHGPLRFKYQGYKDITVHKLTPGCHLRLSRAVLRAPKRANLLCSLLQQRGQLKCSREWPGQLREPRSWLLHGEPAIQPEKVTLILHCRYTYLLYKNDWNTPIGDKHDQILANDKLLHCFRVCTWLKYKVQMYLDFLMEPNYRWLKWVFLVLLFFFPSVVRQATKTSWRQGEVDSTAFISL